MPKRVFAFVLCLAWTTVLSAQPPTISAIDGQRQQLLDRPASIDENQIMRIWVAYIGQGDGILIQLPKSKNYTIEEDGENREERIDILVDGGATSSADAKQIVDLIHALYPEGNATIEHAVITHHDKDHVVGLRHVLDDEDLGVESIYHNGLASYTPGDPIGSLPAAAATYPESGTMIYNGRDGVVKRIMAAYDSTGLKSNYLIGSLDLLEKRTSRYHNIYKQLASSILGKAEPFKVERFTRAFNGSKFIGEIEAQKRTALGSIGFDLLWPNKKLQQYKKNWSYTINGNSITFMLRYGKFGMFFTGDHNEKSEHDMLQQTTGTPPWHGCEVLKVPHHCSKHNLKRFFYAKTGDEELEEADAVGLPIVSISSMGKNGFTKSGHKHPSPEVVDWLGGPHRVYHTHIQERSFDWATITTQQMTAMVEKRHVLIETDGNWFRVVELPLDFADLDNPTTARSVRRGNGTRWIEVK